MNLKCRRFFVQLCIIVFTLLTFHGKIVNAQTAECDKTSSGTCIYKPNLVYIMTSSTSNRLLLTCNDNGDLELTKTMEDGKRIVFSFSPILI